MASTTSLASIGIALSPIEQLDSMIATFKKDFFIQNVKRIQLYLREGKKSMRLWQHSITAMTNCYFLPLRKDSIKVFRPSLKLKSEVC